MEDLEQEVGATRQVVQVQQQANAIAQGEERRLEENYRYNLERTNEYSRVILDRINSATR